MTQQIINTGTIPGDGSGTPIRTAFIYINENFTEVYSNIADISVDLSIFAESGNVDYGTLDPITDPVTFTIDYGSI